jgi:heptosyltransferase II
MKNILIVKKGALGDVVRTSYFSKPLKTKNDSKGELIRLYWFTSNESQPLLRFNPYIDNIATNSNQLAGVEFDTIYSLDDEEEVLRDVSKLNAKKIVGAQIDTNRIVTYCEQSSCWFDMGLLSRLGKEQADTLKKKNKKAHSEIFQELFNVDGLDCNFYNSEFVVKNVAKQISILASNRVPIGLNAFAGKRWASKALSDGEVIKLLKKLTELEINNQRVHLFLFGSGADLKKNRDFIDKLQFCENITALDTDSNILDLAAAIGSTKLLITTDSLCLHLATAQKIPTVAFFAPTSAAEIENFSFIRKIISEGEDYCSYKPDADNSTITSDRILKEMKKLLNEEIND